MLRSRVVIAIAAVAVAIVLQTTVFGSGRIEPFGVAPDKGCDMLPVRGKGSLIPGLFQG